MDITQINYLFTLRSVFEQKVEDNLQVLQMLQLVASRAIIANHCTSTQATRSALEQVLDFQI